MSSDLGQLYLLLALGPTTQVSATFLVLDLTTEEKKSLETTAQSAENHPMQLSLHRDAQE